MTRLSGKAARSPGTANAAAVVFKAGGRFLGYTALFLGSLPSVFQLGGVGPFPQPSLGTELAAAEWWFCQLGCKFGYDQTTTVPSFTDNPEADR